MDELGFDSVIDGLREAVTQLEAGQLSLEEALRVYEHGVALARRGHTVLDSAERRVELLVRADARADGASARATPGSDDDALPGQRRNPPAVIPFDEDDAPQRHGSGEDLE